MTTEFNCVVCGELVPVSESDNDEPKHYHVACAVKAAAVAVVWHGKVLQASEEHLTWTREKDDEGEEGEYYGIAFEDERGVFSATIIVSGVEAEGQGSNALEALDSAYDDLQQETLRIAAKVWKIGQER